MFRLRPDAESAALVFGKDLGEGLSVEEYPAVGDTLRVGIASSSLHRRPKMSRANALNH